VASAQSSGENDNGGKMRGEKYEMAKWRQPSENGGREGGAEEAGQEHERRSYAAASTSMAPRLRGEHASGTLRSMRYATCLRACAAWRSDLAKDGRSAWRWRGRNDRENQRLASGDVKAKESVRK
jgi:hypothetical protein